MTDPAREGRRPRIEGGRPIRIAALTALLVMVLAVAGALPRWPGLVQEVALPPLGLFADLRVLVARAPSYPVFGLGLALSIAARSVLLAATLDGGSRRSVAFAFRLHLAALVPGFAAAGLAFSGQAAVYEWYFWASLVVAVATFVVLGAVPWLGDARLGRGVLRSAARGFRIGTLCVYLAGVIIMGALAHAGGAVASVLLVSLSAALAVGAQRRLAAEPRRRPIRHAVTFAAVLVVLAAAFVVSGSSPRPPRPPSRPGSLFLVAGVDSASGLGALTKLDPRTLGFTCRQTFSFSYLGPGPGAPQRQAACPIVTGARYRRRDTQRPLADLVATFRVQVAALPPPVTVVTHSQGAWIAWAAVAGQRATPVRSLILLAPFPRTEVGYPPPGVDGPGRVGSDVLRVLTGIGRRLGISTFDPDKPLARELLATPGAIERVLARPLPHGVWALAIEPLFDLPLMPEGRVVPDAMNACPVRTTHVGLTTSAGTADVVDRFLDGRPPASCPAGAGWLSAFTAPFGVPPSDT